MVCFCPLFCLLWKQKPLNLSDIWKVKPADANEEPHSWREKKVVGCVFYPFSLSLLSLSLLAADHGMEGSERDECSQEGLLCKYKRVARGQHRGALQYRRKEVWEKEWGRKERTVWYKVHTLILFFIFTLYLFYSLYQCMVEDWQVAD